MANGNFALLDQVFKSSNLCMYEWLQVSLCKNVPSTSLNEFTYKLYMIPIFGSTFVTDEATNKQMNNRGVNLNLWNSSHMKSDKQREMLSFLLNRNAKPTQSWALKRQLTHLYLLIFESKLWVTPKWSRGSLWIFWLALSRWLLVFSSTEKVSSRVQNLSIF